MFINNLDRFFIKGYSDLLILYLHTKYTFMPIMNLIQTLVLFLYIIESVVFIYYSYHFGIPEV